MEKVKSIVSFFTRENCGTATSKKLRTSGMVPAVIYGKDIDSLPIYIEKKDLQKSAESVFTNSIFTLKGKDDSYDVIARSWDVHPVTSDVLHIDFAVCNDRLAKFNVPLVFVNHELCQAIKFGAILNIVRRSLPVKCKSCDLPQNLKIDLKNCVAGQSIKINQIDLPSGVHFAVRDKEAVIATIIGKKAKADAEKPEQGA
jgi:large subunit ribosomal protein L25